MSPTDLITLARDRGITLWVDGGTRLRYRTRAGMLAGEIREQLASNRQAVIDALTGRVRPSPPSPPSPPQHPGMWDATEAIRLETEADGVVEQLGVPGSHPDIQAAVERVTRAHYASDLDGVRTACAEVVAAAKRLADLILSRSAPWACPRE